MIQLEHLHIEDFRGIRLIDLPLASKSFAVHGPNGSGKSGVVDAVDFALTGNISRLAGAGMGGVTLQKHGPHVHRRDDPAAAVVELTVKDTETGETAVLRRNVKEPAKVTLDPDIASIRASVAEAQVHPELTLSRREIIKYVVSRPGERAQEVQALLKLNRLDGYRKLLKTTLGKTSGALNAAEAELGTAEANFSGHLGIRELLSAEIAREINKRRDVLGIDLLDDVTIDTDLHDELKASGPTSTFNLETALREVSDLVAMAADTETLLPRQEVLAAISGEIAEDPTLFDALKHRQLVESGLRDLIDNLCPLCDHDWGSEEALRAHLTEKLDRSRAATEVQRRLLTAAEQYRQGLKSLKDAVDRVMPVAKSHGDAELPHLLANFSAALASHTQEVGITVDSVIAARSTLLVSIFDLGDDVRRKLGELYAMLKAEPDQSATASAQTFLTIAQERWARVRVARAQASKANAVRESAQLVYERYCEVTDMALKSLYETVEADFSRFYQFINSDDEGKFTAQLQPASGSLDLTVDFYGLGKFPPTAYHSEGHQDGMGVCLYLALVKQLLGADFRYAVLDDVVMSVDVNHRRQFCELLKSEFPDVQFIITTHDEVWARQMQSAGLITSKSQARFYGWTVEGGPVYEQGDIWERIDEDLAKDDVAGAAHKLRKRLEAAAADIAELIGGRVPYQGDNSYDLSVLLNAVKGRHRDLLAMAAAAAESWSNEALAEEVREKKKARSETGQESEAWLVNALVHNNDSVNGTVNDFKPVLVATKKFLKLFTCDNSDCSGWIYVVGRPEESLRCDCGTYHLNLKKK